MSIFRFLISKKFFINLSIALILTIVIIWGTLKILDSYTLHGENYILPDYSEFIFQEIQSLSTEGEFEYVVIDSIFDPNKEKGSIVLQDPPPYSKVKKGRKIYLTIVALMPEFVEMPNLENLTLRQAMNILKSVGLKVNSLNYIPDFALNAVRTQKVFGDTIFPETLIEKGSGIDLVLGGNEDIKVKSPFLIGMTQKEANKIINLSSLNVGDEVFLDGKNKIHSRVYQQEPSCVLDTSINLGEEIDVWYRSDLNFDFEELLESLKPDTLNIDSLLMPIDSINEIMFD